MTLINQTIKNLVAGISQQPELLRHPEQLEAQINAMSTETGGLQKRPPTVHVANLGVPTVGSVKPLVHYIKRDNNEKYVVVFNGNGVKVWDLDGNEKTVNYEGNAQNYITIDNPRKYLKTVTIADYSFVVNTERITAMEVEPDSNAWASQGALVNVKAGQYGRTYSIFINGTEVASVRTPTGSKSGDTSLIDTNDIVKRLVGAQDETLPYYYGTADANEDKGYVKRTLYNSGYTAVTTGEGWLYIYAGSTPVTITKKPPETCAELQTHVLADMGVPSYSATLTLVDSVTLQMDMASCYYYEYGAGITAGINDLRRENWTITQSSYYNADETLINRITFKYIEYTEQSTPTNITSLTTKDGFNNQAMFGFMTSAQKFTNLPSQAPNGFTVKVEGEAGSDTDDYYVRFDASANLWKETVKPGLVNAFNKDTMPHILVRESNGTFTFKAAEWTPREAGDDDSNPAPTFVGQVINDVFFFRNRLGFVAGENVILSTSADFFSFWVASMVELQDTDPIDLAVSDSTVATLYQALPFGEDLLLFSESAQFSLKADGVLSPKNAKLNSLTYYASDVSAKPVSAGRNIYFPVKRSHFSNVMEYFTALDDSGTKDAQDIAAHVPNYVPNGVHKIVPSTVENVLLFLTEGAPKNIYVYKYLFLDGAKRQSSWSHWEMTGEVIGADFIDSFLYLLMKREGNYYLERVSFAYNNNDFLVEPYRLYMDRKILTPAIPTEAYDANENTTTINLPSYYNTDNVLEEAYYGVVTTEGVFVQVDKGETSAVLLGDYSGQQVVVGQLFEMKAVMSQLMIKKTDDSGTVSVPDGRLQVQKYWLNFTDSGYFEITVEHLDKGNTYQYIHSSRRLDASNNLLDNMGLDSGTFQVPIQTINTKAQITLTSLPPSPIAIVGAGWSGNYNRRTKQV